MLSAPPDLWLTASEIAGAGLPSVPTEKRLVNRLAKAEGWQDRAGLSRRRRGDRGGAIEYHASLLPVEAMRALAARAMLATDSQRLIAVETAILFVSEGRGNKTRAVAEAALISGAPRSSIWKWWRQVEGMSAEERRAALAPDLQTEAAAKAIAVEADRTAAARVREEGLAGFDQLTAKQKIVAEARAALLRVVAEVMEDRGIGRTEACTAVASGWIDGDDFGVAEVRSVVAKLSARSLERWQADFRRGGLAALAPSHGQHSKGTGVIDRDAKMRTLVEGMLAEFPDVQITTIVEAINARFKGEKRPSKRTVQRWVAGWKERNAAAHLLNADPDAFKNRARLVVGNASEQIVRLNQVWQMDGTPNDVMLKDGKRHAIIGVLDVWSRRIRLIVTKTQTAAAVAACLRKGLMAWGVPELLKMDNGSDYTSKHIERVCIGLGIEQDFCPPFSPEKKPHIERAFRTFSHDLLQLLPGFIGHNVDQRKRIEARKTFAARLMDREAEAPEINMTAEELQQFCDRWCESVYEHRNHSSLGCSPFAQAQTWREPVRKIENERALDTLLMAAPGDGGTRIVTKYGLQIGNARYTDPALQGYWKQRVQVRLDEEDWGRVLVLSEAGEFIAWAICPDRAGVSRAELAAYLRADGKKIESAFRKAAQRAKKDSAASVVASDILAAYEEKASNVVAFPKTSEVHRTEALDAAAEAAERRGKPALIERDDSIGPAEMAKLEPTPVAEIARKTELPRDRFIRWEAIDARVREGHEVGDSEARFWRSYVRSPEHASLTEFVKLYGREQALGEATQGTERSEGA